MASGGHTTQQASSNTHRPVRYLSKDLSWLRFNERILDQIEESASTVFEHLQFLAISAANLDEFFMVRVGRLYRYIAHNRTWLNKLGVSVASFREHILQKANTTFQRQHACFLHHIKPLCATSGFIFVQDLSTLEVQDQAQLQDYFHKAILPMLTPMVCGDPHILPVLMHKALVFGVVTRSLSTHQNSKQVAFVQLPQDLPRFYVLKRTEGTALVPLEVLVGAHLEMLFSDRLLDSVTLFRVIRDRNLSLDESDGVEDAFVEALKRELTKKNQGRIVRLEVAAQHDTWLVDHLQDLWCIGQHNVFQVPKHSFLDLTGLQQLVPQRTANFMPPVPPLTYTEQHDKDLFIILKQQDILLHHPYNSMDLVIKFLMQAATDPHVLAIKITIYRLAKDSEVIAALLKASAAGKHVVVLMEIKARFDEAYNMQEAERLKRGGCVVIYGASAIKTHAKMMLIVRKENKETMRYVHLSSGNYNEETAKSYADVSLLTADTSYTQDVLAFFNAITEHAQPSAYRQLITAPHNMRMQLIAMIHQETQNARQGMPCGIVIKVNALDDEAVIEALYSASQAGVPIQLIVRGICCLVPQAPLLSAHITVRSIVGRFLEHTRIFYFHDQGNAKVYVGSADLMARSFDKRVEMLFTITCAVLKQQVISILHYNLKDNVNSYLMQRDGTYKQMEQHNAVPLNIHKTFFNTTLASVMQVRLFPSIRPKS